MSNIVGEIRWFATGIMHAEADPRGFGWGRAVMGAEQRVWDGHKWAKLGEELSENLKEYYDKQKTS